MRFQQLLAKLGPFSWTLHNIVAHPLSEILHLLGAKKASNWVHDVTIPSPPGDNHTAKKEQ